MANPALRSLALTLALALATAGAAGSNAPLTTADSHVATPTRFSAAQPMNAVAQSDWSALGDPVLAALIAQAWRANTDIRAAIARVAMASASHASARHARRATGGVEIAWQAGEPTPAEFAAAVSGAWELDLSGRLAAVVRGAAADAAASQADLDAVRLLIASDVARTWFGLAGARRALTLRSQYAATQQGIVELSSILSAEGVLAPSDISRSRAEAATHAAEELAARDVVAALEARLAVLLGQTPGQWTAPETHPDLPPAIVSIAVPDLAEVLFARPDVRRAAALLVGRGADAQGAAAARLPRLSLVGLLGFVGGDFGQLFSGNTDAHSERASMQWSLFSLPRLNAEYRRAQAGMDEALAQYDTVVLRAVEEIEVALQRNGTAIDQVQARLLAATESRDAADAAQARYEEGASAYLEPLLARRDALSAELAAVDAIVRQRLILVDVLRALGISPT